MFKVITLFSIMLLVNTLSQSANVPVYPLLGFIWEGELLIRYYGDGQNPVESVQIFSVRKPWEDGPIVLPISRKAVYEKSETRNERITENKNEDIKYLVYN